MNLQHLSDDQLFEIYPKLLKELKSRKLIRANNLVGEMAERFVVRHYNKTNSLPNLKKTITSSENIDAVGNNRKKYQIKSTSGSITGVFASVPKISKQKLFDYVVILIWKNYEIQNIYELTWKQFLKYRKWKKPENKWYLPLPLKIRSEFKKIL